MQIDDFLDLARRRRSVRKFKPDPVPDEYIDKILEAARWAMSGANGQPWEFIVIKNPETKKKMAEIYTEYREMTYTMEQIRFEEYRQPSYRVKQPTAVRWGDAPVIICVVGDPRTVMASTLICRFFELHTVDQNLANATHMINLAAAALGLGAQWVSIHQPLGEALKPVLGIPPVIRPFTLIPIGYPAQHAKPYRRELKELIHYEKYDMSKFRSQTELQEFIKNLRGHHKEAGAYEPK